MSAIAGNGGDRPPGHPADRGRVAPSDPRVDAAAFGRAADGRARLLTELAARIDARATLVAGEVASVLVDHCGAAAGLFADLSGDTEALVHAIAQSLRTGARRADAALWQRWRAVGRRCAEEELALSTVVQAVDAQSRVVVEHLVAEWSTLPRGGRSVEAALMSATMSLGAERVAAVAEAYLDAFVQRRLGTRPAAERCVVDAVGSTDVRRPYEPFGVPTAAAYTVVALLLADSEWSLGPEARQRLALRLESSRPTVATGALWATVGNLGVIVVPATDGDGSADREVVATTCSVAADHVPDARLRLAVAGPYPGLEGIRHGFELARRTLDVAERLGWRGVLRPDDVRLPALLVSAPEVAAELAALLDPLTVAGDPAPDLVETLRQHLRGGRSVEATSRQLGVHPSTVRSRLGRVERLLDVRVPDEATVLELAVMARDLGFASTLMAADQ